MIFWVEVRNHFIYVFILLVYHQIISFCFVKYIIIYIFIYTSGWPSGLRRQTQGLIPSILIVDLPYGSRPLSHCTAE